LATVLAAAVLIGSLREVAFSGVAPEVVASPDAVAPFVLGELSPITAYEAIRADVANTGYLVGETIFPPLVTKPFPRSWFPDKPINSSAYQMERNDPRAYAAGFIVASTVFGDVYLNFGLAGTSLFVFLLGIATAKLDFAFRKERSGAAPAFLVAFYYAYVILRSDTANSVPLIVAVSAMYLILNAALKWTDRPLANKSAAGRGGTAIGGTR
jgi:hypothetical protein